MTLGGWVTMIVSLSFVWGLVVWCFRKVLRTPQEERAPIGLGP
jgi:hypothetical protein